MGLTTALGTINGTSSEVFAVALIFSLVVMYDASGVRLHAGKTVCAIVLPDEQAVHSVGLFLMNHSLPWTNHRQACST